MGNDLTMQNQTNYSVGMTEVEGRQLAEIRGKMVLAKQFPRDPNAALERILLECQNIKLAEVATYSFSRGDSEVKGPSIRLAEVIASHWGNFTCGVTELEQRNGESTVKAYAWDLETNYSDEKVFTVSHTRSTKRGNYRLTDPRDIYEMVANQGARRKRACIFSVIPAYLIEAATEECERVLLDSINKGDLETARINMLDAFTQLDESITQEALEEKIGKPFDKFGSKDIVKLKHLYSAIRDGFVKPAAAFNIGKDANEPELADDDAAKMEEVKNIFAGNQSEQDHSEGNPESDSPEPENGGTDAEPETNSGTASEVSDDKKAKKDGQAGKNRKGTPKEPSDSRAENDDNDGVPDFVKEAEGMTDGADAE